MCLLKVLRPYRQVNLQVLGLSPSPRGILSLPPRVALPLPSPAWIHPPLPKTGFTPYLGPDTMSGPRLSPVALLWSMCLPSHRGNVADFQHLLPPRTQATHGARVTGSVHQIIETNATRVSRYILPLNSALCERNYLYLSGITLSRTTTTCVFNEADVRQNVKMSS